MEKFGREYLKTILEINKHFEGYVDSYFGPPELKKQVEDFSPRSIAVLMEEVEVLGDLIPAEGY